MLAKISRLGPNRKRFAGFGPNRKRFAGSIGTRLIAGYLLIAALALGMGVVGHRQIDRVRHILVNETVERAEARYLSSKIRVECLQVSALITRWAAQPSPEGRVRLATLVADESSVLEELVRQMNRHVAGTTGNGSKGEEQAIWVAIENLIKTYLEQAHSVTRVSVTTPAAGLESADMAWITSALRRFERTRAQLLEQLVLFEDWQTSRLYISRRSAQETVDQARLFTIVLGLIALVGGVLMGLGISMTITRPVGQLVEAAQRITAGDLEHLAEVDSRCEIGVLAGAFNTMAGRLQELIAHLELQVEELNQTQEALRQSEQHYRNLFDSVPVGLYQSTPDGNICEANPSLVQMLAAPNREALLATHAADLYVSPGTRREWQILLASNEVVRDFEAQFRRYDGRSIWIRNSGRAIRDSDGAVLRYEGTIEDISVRKQVQAEREALIAELEDKNNDLERFAYAVSHDLKSPLITIRGFLGFLEEEARSGDLDRLRADIARIEAAADNMQQLLDELLELSRIGRVENAPVDLPIADVAKEAVEMVTGRLQARGVEVDIGPDLPVVLGDRTRLRAVFANLLDNAVKFMGDEESPRIEIASRPDDNDGPAVLVVRDNGIGIDPRYKDRIFGVFEKLQSEAEGSGMGLAIVKRIIEVHGGKIWLESEGLGKGCTFCFTL